MKLIRSTHGAAAALALVLAAAGAAHAQPGAPGGPHPSQTCEVVPDTARNIPDALQIAERMALRDSLVAVGERHGVAGPRGLLFVAVDSTRRGRVLFLDTNLEGDAVQEATARVAAYLQPLEAGRNFQMLVRIDGGYPAPAPGKRHCPPALANGDEIDQMMRTVLEHYPDGDGAADGQSRSALLRVVVSREGAISFVDVDRWTGDEFLDRYVEDIARHLRFHPARMDGEPFDVRIRYRLTFQL